MYPIKKIVIRRGEVCQNWPAVCLSDFMLQNVRSQSAAVLSTSSMKFASLPKQYRNSM
jgi:hypothetical protein